MASFLGAAHQPEVMTFPLFILIETIYPNIWANPMIQNSRCALPVDARRSKVHLLELPVILWKGLEEGAGRSIIGTPSQ